MSVGRKMRFSRRLRWGEERICDGDPVGCSSEVPDRARAPTLIHEVARKQNSPAAAAARSPTTTCISAAAAASHTLLGCVCARVAIIIKHCIELLAFSSHTQFYYIF